MILNANNILLCLGFLSLIIILFSFFYEIYIFNKAPFLKNSVYSKPLNESLSILIPAYNEEINIVNCLKALSEIKKPCQTFKILVIDDLSTDNTYQKALKCKDESVS